MLPRTAAPENLAPLFFRGLVIAAQAATIWITWPLWQVRTAYPPLLPLAPLPQFDMAVPLLVSLAIVVVLPRIGVALHAALLTLAILMDQTRLQPEMISGCLLLVGTLPAEGAKLAGRMHLASLWFFSGFHKLVSPGYFENMREWLFPHVLPDLGEGTATALAGVVAAVEMLLGILILWPRTRKLAAWVALPLHLAIIYALWRANWNTAVWPWNVALSCAGLGLVYFWREPFGDDLLAVRWPVRAAALFLLLSPCGYYFGVLDAYLSYCLYSSNVPRATWEGRAWATHSDVVGDTYYTLKVPLPPSHHTFEAYFHALAEPGERMTIHDPRWCARLLGYSDRTIVQPE